MTIERLTALDRLMLGASASWPQDIGALAILDGSQLPAADGRFPLEAVRERIGRRLYLLLRVPVAAVRAPVEAGLAAVGR